MEISKFKEFGIKLLKLPVEILFLYLGTFLGLAIPVFISNLYNKQVSELISILFTIFTYLFLTLSFYFFSYLDLLLSNILEKILLKRSKKFNLKIAIDGLIFGFLMVLPSIVFYLVGYSRTEDACGFGILFLIIYIFFHGYFFTYVFYKVMRDIEGKIKNGRYVLLFLYIFFPVNFLLLIVDFHVFKALIDSKMNQLLLFTGLSFLYYFLWWIFLKIGRRFIFVERF